MEGKCRLEIFFFVYLLLSLPFDLVNRGLKCFIMGQFCFIKFRLSAEFRYSCTILNSWINQKTSGIGFINKSYNKLADWIYSYATRELINQQTGGQPAGQAQN